MAEAKQSSKATEGTAKPAAVQENGWQGAFKAFGQAFNQIKQNPQPAICFVVVYTLAAIVSSLLQHRLVTDHGYQPYESVVELVFLLALPTYGLALADRRPLTIGQVFQFDLWKFVYLLAAFIMAFVIIVGSVLLFIVPVIWAIGWFSLFQFPIIEHGLDPIAALKESRRLCRNHKGRVWGLLGVSLLLTIAGVVFSFLPFVGSAYVMFVTVLSYGAYATLYRHQQRAVTDN